MKTTTIILLVILATAVYASPDAPFQFERKGTLPSGVRYELKVTEGPYRPYPQLPSDDCGMWGVDCGSPRYSVQDLTLKLNDKKVHFPHKFVDDLSHVRSVEIKDDKNGMRILLRGGDAAGSYSAEFLVRKLRLVERIVRHGEFPDEVWEKTVIGNDLLDHPERY
jgi:hypothetical protein